MFLFGDIEASDKLRNNYAFVHDVHNNILGPFDKINIFVGRNNSGKSRFLRELFFQEKMTGDLSMTESNQYILGNPPNPDHCTIHYMNNRSKKYEGEPVPYSKLLRLVFCCRDKTYLHDNKMSVRMSNRYLPLKLSELADPSYGKRYYIPMIRGMRPFQSGQDVYKHRTIADYFQGKEGNKVLTGLGIYDDLKKRLLGKVAQRRKVDAYVAWLEKQFFEGQSVEVIANEKDGVVNFTIDEAQEHPIYDWGDGMQNLLILTYWPFMKSEGFFFIEEPDVAFHPSMQRKLLEAYASEELKACQFFLTTHSNHLINVASIEEDVAVFTFQKNTEDKVTIRRIGVDDRTPLLLLGAQPSSVMLSNCTIWVEGISDRLTLKHFLTLYFEHIGEKRLREDLHYIFMEYSGGNIIHWSFLSEDGINSDYLCSVAFVIADCDGRTKDDQGKYVMLDEDGQPDHDDKKALRLNTLEEKLDAYVLQVREFENLHTPEFIEAYVTSRKNVAKYLDGDVQPFTFDETRKSNWTTEYMGTLIHEQFEALGYDVTEVNKFTTAKKVKKAKNSNDGETNASNEIQNESKATIYKGTMTTEHKKDLATFAKGYYKNDKGHENYTDLSDDAQNLIKAIYAFILKKNNLEPLGN